MRDELVLQPVAASLTSVFAQNEQKLVLLCIWCPEDRHRPLKKGERYKKSICVIHRQELYEMLFDSPERVKN